MCGSVSQTLHGFLICLPIHKYHTVFIIVAFQSLLESGNVSPLILFFFFKIILLIPFSCHLNFKINLLISFSKSCSDFLVFLIKCAEKYKRCILHSTSPNANILCNHSAVIKTRNLTLAQHCQLKTYTNFISFSFSILFLLYDLISHCIQLFVLRLKFFLQLHWICKLIWEN